MFVLGAIICLVITALAGFEIMRQFSAVHVVVFNTSRSIIVWLFSLAVSWQTFQVLQIVGFLVIVFGVMVFNDVFIKSKTYCCFLSKKLNYISFNYLIILGPCSKGYSTSIEDSVSIVSLIEDVERRKSNESIG